ncbi:MAG: rRNA pseudouridine synthase [Candidatus Omnitrophica bacterium]|nr:rRNA pseudouridine synthase [Candidatus Omnitrophota bacterium]
MKKRLQTILSHAGVSSRRHAAEFIEDGRIKVDGRTVTEKGLKLDPEKHEILVDDRPIRAGEKRYYFLLNKPRGVISTVKDTHGRRKVTDFFKDLEARVYPIGRLDKDTTGIILVTNDGELTHRLSHPRFEIEKEYIVTINGDISPDEITRLERGVEIDERRTSPCIVKVVEKSAKNAVLSVKIHEGRKRQVRRMFRAVGRRVIAIDRVKYAGLTLDGLKRGRFRQLSEEEVAKLRAI